MTETLFTIPRSTGTHADVLLAAGLADLLDRSASDSHARIRERGAAFEVSTSLSTENLTRLIVQPGYHFLQPKAKTAVPEVARGQVLDYEHEKARIAEYYERRKALDGKNAAADPELQTWLQENMPRPDWRQWQVLNLLQGHANTNRVLVLLAEMSAEQRAATVADGLRALQAGQPSGVLWGVSSVQLFNPNAAKGYARLKPDSTDRNDKTKEQWVDGFLEWLRYRGYFLAACPYYLDRKAERIRLLFPIPADISAAALRAVAAELRGLGISGSAPKVDARAALQLVRILIDRSEFGEAVAVGNDAIDALLSLRDRTPAQVVSGLAITQYQSLGSARAVSQVASLALPGWFPIESAEDAQRWRAILDEHDRVLRSLKDDRSDEIGLAVDYRRFLQKRGRAALDALVEFVGAYGAFVLRAREQRRPVASFTAVNLRALVEGMMPAYLAILDDPGFQAVAAAVRRATVSAQAIKARGGKDYREIRYDLLHDLRRKRTLPKADELVEAIAEFVASYNYENARRRETGRQAPLNVTTEELRTFMALVESHGAALVGALLAAYGSCREPREEPISAMEPMAAEDSGELDDSVDDASADDGEGED